MGMDVYGKNPTSEEGSYFRNSIWAWRPLAHYVINVDRRITAQCKEWYLNSGDGLDAGVSLILSELLEEEISSGRTKEYEEKYKKERAEMPDEPCTICGGTGKRKRPPDIGAGEFPCNGCEGKGSVRPSATYYPFSEENVKEFATFLKHCGGFEIW